MKNSKFALFTKGIVLLTLFFAAATFTSCKEEEEQPPFKYPEILGEYTGAYSTLTGNYFSEYTYTVSETGETSVKLTPQDNNGVEFEVTLTKNSDTSFYHSNNGNVLNITKDDNGTWSLTFTRLDAGAFSGLKN